MKKVIIFHGYGSTILHERYKEIREKYSVTGADLDYDIGFENVRVILDELVHSVILDPSEKPLINTILLGHSLGGWWARYFAKMYGLDAVLLNPLAHNVMNNSPILLDEGYLKATFPFENHPFCQLSYYIEQPDNVINFGPYIEDMRKEGSVEVVNNGSHRIEYPKNIVRLVDNAFNTIVL